MAGNSPNAGRDVHLKSLIPKIYRSQWLEACLYGWMSALQYCDEDQSMENNAKAFQAYFNLSEDDYPTLTLKTQFARMRQKLVELDNLKDYQDILNDPEKLEQILEVKRLMENPESIKRDICRKIDDLSKKNNYIR